MYLEVYPDIIFVLNFLLDFILLYLLKMINRRESSLVRRCIAAVLGGLIAAIVGVLPWINILMRFLVMNVAGSTLMLWVAFGKMKRMEFFKQFITFYLITYFVGGLVNSVYYHTDMRLKLLSIGKFVKFSNIPIVFVLAVIFVIVPIALLLIWMLRWYQSDVRETLEIELFYGDYSICTKGFMDTGNCLYDPIFRKPVIIIEKTLLQDLLPPELCNEFDMTKILLESNTTGSEQGLEEQKGLLPIRIIPYQSIGKNKGMMLGFVLDKVLIHKGKEIQCNTKVTAAVCDNQLSPCKEYQVILHQKLIS